MRLTAAGVLGGAGGLRWRLAPLVLGRPEPGIQPEPTMIGLLLLGVGLLAGPRSASVVEVLVGGRRSGRRCCSASLLQRDPRGRVPALTLPGGIRVQLHDVAFALVLAAAVLRLLGCGASRRCSAGCCCSASMLLLSLLLGAWRLAPSAAMAEFRLFLPFVSGALYFATFPPSHALNDRIGQLWLAISIPMMILVCLRWLDNLAGINLGVPQAVRRRCGPQGARRAVYVLPRERRPAHGAFWLRDDRSRRLTRLGALLLLFVVLLNRRTVWLT